ncbi:ATP-binding protein [Pseudomonas sp. GD03858]|uniref:ATP-binding protein n=1 Tax=unclassified Pseudomonas TaxID=196821 RepID=UPI00244B3C26|nr:MULTISPECIES: ATP-binding protein [unclassified Pseudomonas]MDH0646584.1 ATP-binding protein [Pseudomonas sp. GD03867]MDH0662300.1 ATP-binding protein [Pseudomonas sp. GD03858]
MTAIRTRILLPTLLLVLLGSLGLVLSVLRDNHEEIENVYDAQLVQAARVLQGLFRQMPAEQDWQGVRAALEQAMEQSGRDILSHPYEINLDFMVWRSDGQLLMRSADAPHLDSPPAPGIHDLLYQGQDWCGVLLEDRQRGLLIWVGERDDLRQDLIQRIADQALAPALVGIPLLAVAIWLLLGWGLQPLRRLARHLRVRPVDSLEPLAVAPLPPELAPMANALNHQLQQLTRLLERERRFIADAAHELRTPLAVLAIHASNARRATCDAERDEALVFLEQGVARATRLASQLLTMARLEPLTQVRQRVRLDALAREELAQLAPLALRRQVDLVLDEQGSCHLYADPTAVTVMLQNLIGNALHFSPPGGEVTLELRQHDDWLTLQVLDQGPGVAPQQLARLSDRFYSDSNPGGAGLGLAIVALVVEQLGGGLEYFNRDGGGFGVKVRFAASPLPQ